MIDQTKILCIGSVLWDVIGRSASHMRQGSDVPGRITRLPGGVAMNVAMTLVRFGMTPALLTAIGRDPEGDELVAACHGHGLICDHIYRSDDLPTDRYMAVEGANGLIAAIADAHSLEMAGAKILGPLSDGTLGSSASPYPGHVVLDGNLTLSLLEQIADSPLFSHADLRVAPASPGKAERLRPFFNQGRATLYVNLEEAGLLCRETFDNSADAAQALVARGVKRALVTDGGKPASDSSAANTSSTDNTDSTGDLITQTPPDVLVTRVTGAGDTFMAAHIAAEASGNDRQNALNRALLAAATYVSGETPL